MKRALTIVAASLLLTSCGVDKPNPETSATAVYPHLAGYILRHPIDATADWDRCLECHGDSATNPSSVLGAPHCATCHAFPPAGVTQRRVHLADTGPGPNP
jgi:hypothetical protein